MINFNNKGFNVIELLTAVSLIALLSFFTFRFGSFLNKKSENDSLKVAIVQLADLIEGINQKGNIVNINKELLSIHADFPDDLSFSDNTIWYRNEIDIGVNIIPGRIVSSESRIGKQSQGFFVKPKAISTTQCVSLLNSLEDGFTLIEKDGALIKTFNGKIENIAKACDESKMPHTILFYRI